ncbi:hypothetical protein OCU04_007923 [Sclerotinia nivalis]|uniref:Uncharacterized protein n=1 Tax=Sclerotinia nivalis TaxID=352851 RepID=A0A9X0AKP5_9HELO|nr:hypothetical protein OCU04_007923 [Sclerotinia nivalis]
MESDFWVMFTKNYTASGFKPITHIHCVYKYRKTDESTVENVFEQSNEASVRANRLVLHCSVQKDDLMKASISGTILLSTDVTIDYGDLGLDRRRRSPVFLDTNNQLLALFFSAHLDGASVAGLEDEFPPSDNVSKLKRSCEKAEHGLPRRSSF